MDVAERSGAAGKVDVGALAAAGVAFELRRAESPEERDSRLRREEADEAHKRRLDLIAHIFAMAIVAVAFTVSVYITLAGDPKTVLPDRAMNTMMAVVGAAAGYITGKATK